MKTILICEDNIPLGAYWRRLLEEQGFIAYCCETVTQALELTHKLSPDLIITDMIIKENGQILSEGGITLVSQLRLARSSIPIMCISGYRPSQYNPISALEIAKTMKINQALYKPITAGKLLAAVHDLL